MRGYRPTPACGCGCHTPGTRLVFGDGALEHLGNLCAELGVKRVMIISDPGVTIERIMGFAPAVSSTDTELFEVIQATSEEFFPGSRVIPSVSGGFTDSHFFRDLGIVSYGYAPFVLQATERRGIHGNNERVSVENVERGTRVMTDLLRRLTVD